MPAPGTPMPDDRRVLQGVDRLVVDGTNVLHALRRTPSPLPAAALVGRLRSIVPAGVSVIVVLDGSPEHGLVARHVAAGVEVRYSGRFTADDLIVRLAEHDFAAETAGLLVVTDDNDLAATVRRAGGRTVRNGWLVDRLGRQRLSAPSAGQPAAGRPPAWRPPAPSQAGPGGSGRSGAASGAEADAEGPRWSPGRGATRKVGNAHRRPRSGPSRH